MMINNGIELNASFFSFLGIFPGKRVPNAYYYIYQRRCIAGFELMVSLYIYIYNCRSNSLALVSETEGTESSGLEDP